MIVLGLTGSLASGKSAVARLFRKRGAKVFDADLAAKRLVRKGSPTHGAIVKLFGRQFLQKNGELDRKKLAGHVFKHPKDLQKLNILTHPAVIFDCLKVISRHRRRGKGLLVLDVPLLFESHMQNLADATIVVTAPKEKLLRRAAARGVRKELAGRILSAQWPMEKKAKLADFVIRNDGSLKSLEKQVSGILEKVRAI